jgi:hypothetical protein
MDDSAEFETVNPYDPPERQALEQQLEDDTQIEHQLHSTIQQEQHLADAAQHGGRSHQATDARLHELEDKEQVMAGKIVEDQQAIDHWDHSHPGWDQADAAPADETGSADDGSIGG